jgi:hypothetical protein
VWDACAFDCCVARLQDFLAEIEQFRKNVAQQGQQLTELRRWLGWEREGLKELKMLKVRTHTTRAGTCRSTRALQAEREARFASLKALQTQLELHAGYLVQMRDKHYPGAADSFDDDVRPKLVKKLNGVRCARGV